MAKPLPKKAKATVAPPAKDGGWFTRPAVIVCALIAATFAAYWQAAGFDFTNYDDADYITHNWHVLTGLTWENVRWAFTTGYMGNWLPLSWLSHMLDVELFGTRAGGPHMVNVAIHAVNGALVFLWLRQMTHCYWRSALVAALFALHPLRVESVAWACERRDVLSVFFGLLALMFYTRYVQAKARNPKSGIGGYALVFVFFAASLMSKPMLVTLPFALLLLDYWPLGRVASVGWRVTGGGAPSGVSSRVTRLPSLLWEKIPFFALAVFFSVLTVKLQKAVGAVSDLETLALNVRLENALVSYVRYLGKIFWPADLALPYLLTHRWALWQVAGSAALLVGVSVLAVWWVRRHRFVAVGWFWFVGTLVPVIGIVQAGPQAMADRFVYLPTIGVLVIVVWGLGELAGRWRIPKPALVGSALVVLVALTVRTTDQLKHWRNTETLFLHTLAVAPDNDSAMNSLGVYYAGEGRSDEAIDLYQRALVINPRHAQTLNNLGNAQAARQQYPQAIENFQKALGISPNQPEAYVNLGAALAATGRLDEAVAQFNKALELRADNPDACNNLGNVLVMKGNITEGIAMFRRVVQQRPTDADSHFNLGNALALGGQTDEAIKEFQEALRLQPTSLKARNNLGCAYQQAGRLAEAVTEFERVLQSSPDVVETNLRLGSALAKLGRRDEATARLMRVLQLQPGNPEAMRELSALGVATGQR